MTSARLRAAVAVAGAVLLAAGAAGCKTGTDDEMTPRPTDAVTATPVRTPETAPVTRLPVVAGLGVRSAVVWAQGTTIHVGRRTIDVAPLQVDALAPGWHGIYFLSGGTVWFTDLTRASATRLTGVTRLLTTPDRRYLGLVDLHHGPQDDFGTSTAGVLVYDTSTGDRVLRSYAGMGAPPTQRLAALYRAHPPEAVGFSGTGFFARTPRGLYSYDVTSGAAHRVAAMPAGWRQTGPSGEYRVLGSASLVVRPANGPQLRVRGAGAGFRVAGWLSPTRLYGLSGRRVLSCNLRAATCTRVALAGSASSGPVVVPLGAPAS